MQSQKNTLTLMPNADIASWLQYLIRGKSLNVIVGSLFKLIGHTCQRGSVDLKIKGGFWN